MDKDQTHQLEWRDGAVPVSIRFNDPFFSLEDGVAETRHVFLAGNDLPARFRPGFRIAELGFGTGLNFLVTLMAFRANGGQGLLHFTSFEAFPMAAADRLRALAAYPALPEGILTDDDIPQITGPDFTLTVIPGDARQTLPVWDGQADAWFLDGFSPAKNPQMWEPGLLMDVARHTAPGGTCASYTAAGHVRSALADAGFAVTRMPGHGRKRHMTTGRLP